MADENELELVDEQGQDNSHPIDKRINKALSDKTQAQLERDEALKAKEQSDAEKATALKEVEFFKNFSQMTSKYAGATEYQDQIKEKVMAGYDVEDATISILARENKYTPTVPETPIVREHPAGGSAPNAMRSGGGEKSINEMTQDERRQALVQAESEGGEVSRILRM